MVKKVFVRQSAIFSAEQFNPPNEIPNGVTLHTSKLTGDKYFGRLKDVPNITVLDTDWVLRQGIGVNQSVTVITNSQFIKNFVRVASALYENDNT